MSTYILWTIPWETLFCRNTQQISNCCKNIFLLSTFCGDILQVAVSSNVLCIHVFCKNMFWVPYFVGIYYENVNLLEQSIGCNTLQESTKDTHIVQENTVSRHVLWEQTDTINLEIRQHVLQKPSGIRLLHYLLVSIYYTTFWHPSTTLPSGIHLLHYPQDPSGCRQYVLQRRYIAVLDCTEL